jgi:hypothetical protein
VSRGPTSFLVKMANVANPANVANAVLRQQAMWPIQPTWTMQCSARLRSRRGGTPPCFSGLLCLLLILLL